MVPCASGDTGLAPFTLGLLRQALCSTRRATFTRGQSDLVSPSLCQVCQHSPIPARGVPVCPCLAWQAPGTALHPTGSKSTQERCCYFGGFGPQRFPCSRLGNLTQRGGLCWLSPGQWLQPWHSRALFLPTNQTPVSLRTSAVSPVPPPSTPRAPRASSRENQPLPCPEPAAGAAPQAAQLPSFSALSHAGPRLSRPNASGFGV